jgi:hypothetical protein
LFQEIAPLLESKWLNENYCSEIKYVQEIAIPIQEWFAMNYPLTPV